MELTLIEICLLGCLIFCFFIQLYFSLFVHLKLALFSIEPLQENGFCPLSVVICARNEADNLERYLIGILEQDYPLFEVVVVNDRSWDATGDLLISLSEQYSHLKIVAVTDGNKFRAGKKFAMTMGIKAAKYDWLVLTDADCEPVSKNWLRGMQQPDDPQITFLLGYSPYHRRRGILNALVCFETFFTAVNYLSFALKGMPYMGVGRNLAYKKEVFFKNKGYAAHMHIASGDDDLFVNAHAHRGNTQIRIHPDVQVWTSPKTSWRSYLRQKKRHAGAGKFYKGKHRVILSAQVIFQFLFYLFFAVLLFFKPGIYFAAGILLLSILIRCFVYPRLLKRLSYGHLRWWFPILDVLLLIFLLINGIVSIFVRNVEWK